MVGPANPEGASVTPGYKPCPLCGSTIPDEPTELDDLRAEVERLRKHRELCTVNLLKGYETGKTEERAAVVVWLRECALDPEATGAEFRLLLEHATRIERGEHRREEKE